jgi:hypothetical protein
VWRNRCACAFGSRVGFPAGSLGLVQKIGLVTLRGLTKRYQYIENLTWSHGSHSVKTGFNISYYPWFSLF